MLCSSLNKKVTAIYNLTKQLCPAGNFNLFVLLKLPLAHLSHMSRRKKLTSALNIQYIVGVIVCCRTVHHTCYILFLGKQSDSDFVFWFWVAIMSPGRWSRSDWGSGRHLLPGRGSCRLGKETWSNRPLPGPGGPATSQTLKENG